MTPRFRSWQQADWCQRRFPSGGSESQQRIPATMISAPGNCHPEPPACGLSTRRQRAPPRRDVSGIRSRGSRAGDPPQLAAPTTAESLAWHHFDGGRPPGGSATLLLWTSLLLPSSRRGSGTVDWEMVPGFMARASSSETIGIFEPSVRVPRSRGFRSARTTGESHSVEPVCSEQALPLVEAASDENHSLPRSLIRLGEREIGAPDMR